MELRCERASEASWRVSRLTKAVNTFCSIYGITRPQLSALIDAMEDQKGILHIYWKDGLESTPEQRRVFGISWGICGEPEENVRHHEPSVI